ncbi:MAG: hypothetical protein A2W90_00655 [Bacteroidetes bacterium GWF2_42_66]|nr:MAG: hypothetical protein A2W92_21510 [Bacteroidetes bacterium GWA2_42_15]OFY02132.1 MAG: hypothetical protein A2W89_11840 [Bacteroidetes bacterium GWE2_42_39]OFY43478.1 MAG: hypothetical protein A2W90_00655 [Bacteroidetes bacterium GWF2_42_66]
MKPKLTPEELRDSGNFELLTEVPHLRLKEFIIEQIREESQLIKAYSAYQVAMIVILIATIVKAIVMNSHGMSEPLQNIGFAVLFSFTVLVIIHELLHAAAYWLTGSRKLVFGAIWQKFIFYVMANRQVISPAAFRVVANAPLVTVKVATLILTIFFWHDPAAYFFLTIMCLHSLFCAGDIAMLAFYRLHPDKEIFNYDDINEKVTYFYFRKK